MSGERPEPPFYAEDGYEWTVVPDTDWSLDPATVEGLTCRRLPKREHGAPAVAVLYRPSNRWGGDHLATRTRYGYCAEHMYGRWIEDGKVVMWRLVAPAVPA